MKVSVIIPVLNEEATVRVGLALLQPLRDAGHEVIVVDGGSEDNTEAEAAGLCDQWLVSARRRARQMNAGAARARGNLLVFLHADTRLPHDTLHHFERFMDSGKAWGRFDVRLSGHQILFRVVGGMMNWRSRVSGICTGDQVQFVRREVFEDLGGFADIDLMEDIDLSRRLKSWSRPYCISSRVITDSRRWEIHGPWRTILFMWRLRWAYWRGVSAGELASQYHRHD